MKHALIHKQYCKYPVHVNSLQKIKYNVHASCNLFLFSAKSLVINALNLLEWKTPWSVKF